MILRDDIFKDIFPRNRLAEFFLNAYIPESFDGAYNRMRFIPQEGCGNAYGETLPVGIDDINGLVDDRLSRDHGFLQTATLFADIRFQNVAALLTDGFLFRYAGYLFRSPIKGGNAPFEVYREDSVGDGIENDVPMVI